MGDTIIKYGVDIGEMYSRIAKGQHAHVHNLKTKRSSCADSHPNPLPPAREEHVGELSRMSGRESATLFHEGAGARTSVFEPDDHANQHSGVTAVKTARQRAQPRHRPAVEDLSNAASEAIANSVTGTLAIPHPYGRLQFGATSTCIFVR